VLIPVGVTVEGAHWPLLKEEDGLALPAPMSADVGVDDADRLLELTEDDAGADPVLKSAGLTVEGTHWPLFKEEDGLA
jgi:hypothetical protein